jgi:hypothetical protein
VVRVLIVSTYELGHQPLHAASAAAALLEDGHEVRCLDVALERLDPEAIDWCERVAIAVPMHTAAYLGLRVAAQVRRRRPRIPVCFFGLYARSSSALAPRSVEDAAIAGEYEEGLAAWSAGRDPGPAVQLSRRPRPVPARHLLPALDRYARLAVGGEERLVGYVEASRGCSHRCRHCPVPVVYDGRVRRTDEDVVLSDVDQLVEAGARHVTFADPDFLNAPHHSRRVVEKIHERHPGLTFDCTTKVEHILRHRELWPELARNGCLFVVSAFESVNESVLGYLDKGHSAAEASRAVALLRESGIEVRPSWLPFTPWTSVADLVSLVDFVVAHDLVRNVDPVQYTIRLLVPEGSLLLGRPELRRHLGGYDEDRLSWTWVHPEPAIDLLQERLASLVEERIGEPATATFEEVASIIRSQAGGHRAPPAPGEVSRGPGGDRPHLTEAWFCCSEPTGAQLAALG